MVEMFLSILKSGIFIVTSARSNFIFIPLYETEINSSIFRHKCKTVTTVDKTMTEYLNCSQNVKK